MRRIVVVALTLIVVAPLMPQAQRASRRQPVERAVDRPVPFKVGETLIYDMSW
jgi:hypothetical protein